jgi:hypothetical protein
MRELKAVAGGELARHAMGPSHYDKKNVTTIKY